MVCIFIGKTISQTCTKELMAPVVPTSFNDLFISPEFTTTVDDKPFLSYNIVTHKTKIFHAY